MVEPRVFVWSDLHLFHLNVIKYTHRPFEFSQEGMEEQNRVILRNYQQIVQPQDLVLFLGDIAFYKSQNREPLLKIFSAMPGHKILLVGNHDSATDTFYKALGFSKIEPYLICGKYFLCHYPISLEPDSKAEIQAKEAFLNSGCTKIIHGHTHTRDCVTNDGIERWNVCVDYGNNNFSPLLIEDPQLTHDLLALLDLQDGNNQVADPAMNILQPQY